MFPRPNTSLLVASEQEEIKAYTCALAKANALRTEGSVFSHFLGRTNHLGHFRGGYWISRGRGKKPKKKKRKTTSNNRKGSGMAWCICSEAEHRLEQNLEKAKGSGYAPVES